MPGRPLNYSHSALPLIEKGMPGGGGVESAALAGVSLLVFDQSNNAPREGAVDGESMPCELVPP